MLSKYTSVYITFFFLIVWTATCYCAYYSSVLLTRPLVQAYLHTEDRDSFIAILRQIHDSIDRAGLADDDSSGTVPDRTELVGNFVLDIAAVGRNRVVKIEALLQVRFISIKPCNMQIII
jgi:hypothetical protein